jgi:AcrR family transcriptional regulator
VSDKPGLREQHKRRTREAIGGAAMSLFFELGYDTVTVADVARQAGVSVATVFNYFNAKEDLFFDEVDELQADLVAAVRQCPPGESVLAYLQRQVVHQLTAGRPESAADEVVRFHAAIVASADLQRREQQIQLQRRQALAAALADALGVPAGSLPAELAAALYLATEAVIAARLRTDLLAGRGLAQALGKLEPVMNQAFGTLRCGLGALDKARLR